MFKKNTFKKTFFYCFKVWSVAVVMSQPTLFIVWLWHEAHKLIGYAYVWYVLQHIFLNIK